MAESSIGPTNWMLRADSSQLAGDVDKAKAKIEKGMAGVQPVMLKAFDAKAQQKELMGGIMRLNPLLGALDLGIGKGTAKILSRELSGILGEGKFTGLASGLSSFAAKAGAAALGAYVLNKSLDFMFKLAGRADPALLKEYNAAWDSFTAAFGNLFVPMLKDATGIMKGMAVISKTAFGSETSKGWIGSAWDITKTVIKNTVPGADAVGGILGSLWDIGTNSAATDAAATPRMQGIAEASDALTLAAYGSDSPAEQQKETNSWLRQIAEKLGVVSPANERALRGG